MVRFGTFPNIQFRLNVFGQGWSGVWDMYSPNTITNPNLKQTMPLTPRRYENIRPIRFYGFSVKFLC